MTPTDGGWAWADRDEAVARLEDHVLSLPYDRALPDLAELLAAASVDEGLLAVDERARKLVVEAVLARPLSDRAEIAARSAEVELLVIEVGVLTDDLRRAAAPDAPDDERARAERARARLVSIRRRLAELRSGL